MKGKVALGTGGSSGMGCAAAISFARNGANLCFLSYCIMRNTYTSYCCDRTY